MRTTLTCARRVLSLSVAAALTAPLAMGSAVAANTTFVANGGESKSTSGQSYETTSNGWSAVAAKDGGHVDAEATSAITHAAYSDAVNAARGGTITFNGGEVTVNGLGSSAFRASDAALVNVGRAADGSRTVINVNGDSASAARASGGGVINLDGVHIIHSGDRSDAFNFGSGVAVDGGGTVNVSDSIIETSGTAQGGVAAGRADAAVAVHSSSISTLGDRSHGALAFQAGAATVDDTSVETQGAGAHGIFASGMDSSATARNVKISTQGTGSMGAFSADNAVSDLIDTDVETFGSNAHGIQATAGGIVNATRVNVTAHGYGSAALLAEGVGSTIRHDGGTLRSEGSLGNSASPDRKATVTSQNGALVQLDNVLIENLYTNTVSGPEGAIPDVRLGMGILADGGSVAVANSHIEAEDGVAALERGAVTLDNTTITALGGWGLLAGGEGSTAVMNGGSILVEQSAVTPNTPSSNGRAVAATVGGHVSLTGTAVEVRQLGGNALETYGAGSLIDMTGGSVLTTADKAWGALAGYGDHVDFVRGGQINFDGTLIETRGAESIGLFAGYDGAIDARSTQVLTSGERAHGSELNRGSLTLDNSQIHTTGMGAAVVDASAGSTFSAAGSTLVSDQHTALQLDDATVSLSDGTAIQGGNGLLATFGSDTANTLVFDRDVVALGDIRFADGALDSDGNGLLDRTSSLSLDNSSYWQGATDAIGDLSLAHGSRWDVTGSSTVGNLSLADSSVVFDHADGQYKTLTVDGNFHADNGLLAMNTALGDDASPTDLLHVKGDTSGNAHIAVNNIGGTGAQTEDGIKLVQVDGVSAGEYALAGRAVGGAYEYFLFQGGRADPNDGDWYLRSELSPVDPVVDPPVDPVDPVIDPPMPTPVFRPEAGAYLANQASALGLFDMDLHERVGEPNLAQRQRGDGKLGSAWARVITEQPRYRVNDQLVGQGRHNVVQIGSDLTFWGNQDRGVVGVMAASGQASNRITSELTGYGAEGRVDGRALGVYGTWMQNAEDDDGLYIDGWLQAAQFKNRVQGDALAREEYRSHSLSASLEAGYAVRLHQNDSSALYLEPQVQAIWTDYRMDGGQHQEVNGTVVKSAEAGGLQTRVGARLYGHSTAAEGNRVQPFVAVNWIRNGSDANAVWLGNQRLQGIVPKDVYEAKAGAQLQLSPKLTGWGELSIQNGGYGFRSVGGQLGVKYAW